MILRTRDCPDANGRIPNPGEMRWSITLPLEDGQEVTIYMSKKDRDSLFGMLIADYHDCGEPEPR